MDDRFSVGESFDRVGGLCGVASDGPAQRQHGITRDTGEVNNCSSRNVTNTNAPKPSHIHTQATQTRNKDLGKRKTYGSTPHTMPLLSQVKVKLFFKFSLF